MEDGPVLSLINKRLRTLRKKLSSKPSVAAAIHEIEKLRRPLSAAIAEEICLAVSVKSAGVNGVQVSNDILSDSDLESKKGKKLHSGKKRKSLHIEATDGEDASVDIEGKRSPKHAQPHVSTTEITSSKHESNIDGSLLKLTNATDEKQKLKKSSTANDELDINGIENKNQEQSLSQNLRNMESQSNSSEEEREVASQLEKTNAGVEKQPNKGALWAQKSSWTDLVGRTNASFSISQLLPDTKFKDQEQVDQPKNWFASKLTVDKPNETVVKSTSGVAVSDLCSKASLGVAKAKAVRASLRYSVGETCSFMRSDASMKEWKSAKAALSASLKKKIDKNK